MPYVNKTVWVDEKDGPDAYKSKPFINGGWLWDGSHPNWADKEVCRALTSGGFGTDWIDRQVSDWEAQVIAIRRGLVDLEQSSSCYISYRINDAGRALLRAQGQPEPEFLTATDSWHNSRFEYVLWTVEENGRPYLKFAKELYPRVSVGMHPLLGREAAETLRDYLTAWLTKTAPTNSPTP